MKTLNLKFIVPDCVKESDILIMLATGMHQKFEFIDTLSGAKHIPTDIEVVDNQKDTEMYMIVTKREDL